MGIYDGLRGVNTAKSMRTLKEGSLLHIAEKGGRRF